MEIVFNKAIKNNNVPKLKDFQINQFCLVKHSNYEVCKPEKTLSSYLEGSKNNKKMIHNFKFDLFNHIVLRLFGTESYVYVPYNYYQLENLDKLKKNIKWNDMKDLEILKTSIENKELLEKDDTKKETYLDHIYLNYQ